jgi:hypothetical protein
MTLVRKSELWLDGFTYGDWKQYCYPVGKDAVQCCRRAQWPTFMSIAGVILFATMAMGTIAFGPPTDAAWFLFALSGALNAPVFIELAMQRLFVVDLGPTCPRMDDGGFYRLFPGEGPANDR